MSEITEALNLICEGRVTEIRLFDTRGRTHFGYFDNYEVVEQELVKFGNRNGHPQAVYFVPNEIDPSLLARQANALKYAGRGDTTSDGHVIRRRWLLIDLDPERVSGVSSTDEEKGYSLTKARAMFSHLRGQGWPDPVIGDSSNGTHMLYRIDEPADDEGLIERCLKALAQQFDDAQVHVDQKVFNPARIFKLYGTISRKGSDIPERPHREAKILARPTSDRCVATDQLRALASELSEPQRPQQPRTTSRNIDWSLERWLQQHGVEIISGPVPWRDAQKWQVPCPFDEGHYRDAFVAQNQEGRPQFHCSHNSCSDKGWRDYRQSIEPGCYDRQRVFSSGPPMPTEPEVELGEEANGVPHEECPAAGASEETQFSRIDVACAVSDFIEELGADCHAEIPTGIPQLDAALGGGVAPGELVILAARPSNGKTMVALQLAHHICQTRPGLFITLDMSVRALAKRCLQYISPIRLEHWETNAAQLRQDADDHFERRRSMFFEENLRSAEEVIEAIKAYHEEEEIAFVVIDYIQNLAAHGVSRYEAVTKVSAQLRHVASETGVTVFALAQLNRQLEQREGLTPRLSDLKESGQLEQDADVVVGLVYPHRSRPNDYSVNHYQMFVLKNRNRPTGRPTVDLSFDPPRQMVSEQVPEPARHWEP